MQLFLQDLCLRPSCYRCPSRKLHRRSDLTRADFWGCDVVCPDLDDDTGLSLVFVHSEKGQRVFDALPLQTRSVTVDQALTANKAMLRSPAKPQQREEVLSALDTLSLEQVGKRYLRKLPMKEAIRLSIPTQVIRTAKKLLKR